MTKISAQILIIVLYLSIFRVDLGSAQLFCWACDPCPDPFVNTSSSVTLSTCTTSQTVCVKNTLKILNQASQISKGCVTTCTPSASKFFGQGAFVDCCNTNLCNLSTRNQSSLTISILFITIFGFIFYGHHLNSSY